MASAEVLKYLQESRKYAYFTAALLGAILVAVPVVAMAAPSFVYTESAVGKEVNAVNNAPATTFLANASQVTSGTAQFNFIGVGGNDTFTLYGGNATMVWVATGKGPNTFNINKTGNGNFSIFSMISGANSSFNIVQNNFNGTDTFAITGGIHSIVNETSYGKQVADTFYSINLGTNSTVILGSDFQGNATTVNVVF